MNSQSVDPSMSQVSLVRLKALADGVFAIVITILALDLDVPQMHDFSGAGVGAFFARIEHQLLPYLASFALVAGYWVMHHVVLNFVNGTNRTFMWLNLLFMLPLTLTPYFTSMRADYPGVISVAALFGGLQIIICLLLLLLWHYGLRHLNQSPVAPGVVRSMDVRVAIIIGLYILGVVAAPTSERLSAILFLGAPPLVFIRHRIVDRPSGKV